VEKRNLCTYLAGNERKRRIPCDQGGGVKNILKYTKIYRKYTIQI